MLFVQFFAVIMASTIIDTYSIILQPPQKANLEKFMNHWIKYDKEVRIKIRNKIYDFLYNKINSTIILENRISAR